MSQNEEQVRTRFAQILQEHGHFDILVNNAGIGHVGNILETSLEDWERVRAWRLNAHRQYYYTTKYTDDTNGGAKSTGGILRQHRINRWHDRH